MGRAGGTYEQPKKGKKKRIGGTEEAEPVAGDSTRLDEQEAAEKAANTETTDKE